VRGVSPARDAPPGAIALSSIFSPGLRRGWRRLWRSTAAQAEAFESPSFDHAKVEAANAEQASIAERLRSSVKQALEQMHALLDVEQRKKFAYLLRAGILAI
jgi:Spy/CpxP family protein refolding chaperone